MKADKVEVDIIIPVFNEDVRLVESLIDKIFDVLHEQYLLKIYVIDDGSNKQFKLNELAENSKVIFLTHDVNKGYSTALKTGILAGTAKWIGIVDADATYPVEQFQRLLTEMDVFDMVVGTRTGETREIPLIRRFPKYCLNRFASYMANQDVSDLNSGMRVFTRELCNSLWSFYPKRFSFTSTITMGAYLYDFKVKKVAIDYFKRDGKSSIRPIHDTLHFANIILRMGLLFHPLKIFSPIALFLLAVGIIKGLIIDYGHYGYVGNMSVFVMISGMQILLMGYLADLVVRNRNVKNKNRSI